MAMTGAAPSAPAPAAVDDRRDAAAWRAFFAIALILAGLALLPLVLFEHPAMADYPNHLARVHILLGDLPEGWQAHYWVRHALIPNLGLDLTVPFLVQAGLSPDVAMRVFAGLAYLAMASGTLALAATVNRSPPWFALLVFPLCFNRYYLFGFLNYVFSVGLALWLMAGWLRWRERPGAAGAVRLGVLAGAALLTLTAHLMGFCVFLLCAGSYELAVAARRAAPLRERLLPLVRLAAVGLPSVLAYLFVFQHGGGLRPIFDDVLRAKVAGVLSPVVSYNIAFGVVTGALLLLLAGWLLLSRRRSGGTLSWSVPAWAVVAALLLTFVILPSGMMGSGMLDRRLFICVVFFGIGLAVARLDAMQRRAVVATAFALLGFKLYEVGSAWHLHTQAIREIRAALQALPTGTRLVSFSYGSSLHQEFPPVRFAYMFALIDKAAYVPGLFAYPYNGESVAYRESDVAARALQGGFMPPQRPIDWPRACKDYEHVLVTFELRAPPADRCAVELSRGRHFVLYRSQGAGSSP